MAQTPEKRAYNKELKRISEEAAKLVQEGYVFIEDLGVRNKTNPSRADVEKLKSITRETLLEKVRPNKSAVTINNVIDIAQQNFEAPEYYKKFAKQQEMAEANYYEYNNAITDLNRGPDSSILKTHTLQFEENSKYRRNKALEKIENAVQKYGVNVVAEQFNRNAERLQDIINTIIYNSDQDGSQFKNALMELDSILSGGVLTLEESQRYEDEIEE